MIKIEVLDINGQWRIMTTTINNFQVIRQRLTEWKRRFPDRPVRAVDTENRLVDII